MGLAPGLLLLATGCLYVGAAKVEEDPVNHPPVILTDQLFPKASNEPIVAQIGERCAPQQFHATVVDFDGDEEVHAKWILTGELENGTLTRLLLVESQRASKASVKELLGEEVEGAKTYPVLTLQLDKVTLRAGFDDPESLAMPGRTHLLELWVSDRRFGASPTDTVPVGREGEPRPVPAYVSWIVELQDTDCPSL